MFNKLSELNYKRNFNEAFGFYIAYLVLGTIVAALLCAVFASNNYGNAFVLGQKFAIIYSLALSFWV